jgi:hypothetical protein
MDTIEVYLASLLKKVFKLLPMREDYDMGADNHLFEYLDDLCEIYANGFEAYPELSMVEELVDVRTFLLFLQSNPNIEFSRWRTIILKSSRLINSVISKRSKGV